MLQYAFDLNYVRTSVLKRYALSTNEHGGIRIAQLSLDLVEGNGSSEEAIIGYIDHDEGQRAGANQSIMIGEEQTVRRGVYVRIRDPPNAEFVARIVDGPIYTVKVARYLLELTSMVVGGTRTMIQSRPKPGSPVRLMSPEATQAYLGAVGDINVGRLVAQKEVKVSIQSSTFTSHIGIFGTTGSGKSNCLQVIAEEASEAGRSILILDIEGEYVRMNEPTMELQQLLMEFGKKPHGIKDLHVYVPAQNTSLNHEAKRFGIPLADIDLEIFSEVLGLSPFERVYMYEVARKARDTSGNFHAFDMNSLMTALRKRIEAQVDNTSIPEVVAEAHMGLFTKLSLAQRAGIIDSHFEKITPESICVPGRVSVIDMSESSDIVRNICVAHFLKSIFRYKTRTPNSSPIIIFAEEIHTFISRAKITTMLATLTMLIEIARQGRKRGISLGLVSQQPALVPSELIELCNTRFIHRVSSTPNIEVLRQSTGNVPDSLWSILLSLGKGEALVSSPSFDHAVITQIRPNKSKRLRVEQSNGTSAPNSNHWNNLT